MKRPTIYSKKKKFTGKTKVKEKGKTSPFWIEPIEEVPDFLENEKEFLDFKGLSIFPSPKPLNKIFTEKWDEYIVDVVKRDNFKKGHLFQLSILCDLYSEHDHLLKEIKKHGYFYEMIGKHGLQIRPRPEVSQLNKTRSEIRSYSKTLGLLLMKDRETIPQGEEKEQWD